MYSTIENGKVLDWHFYKRKGMENYYVFYLGDEKLVGQIWKMPRGRWSAVAPYPMEGKMHHIDGLASRLDAAEFLLRIRRYWLTEKKFDAVDTSNNQPS